MTNLYEEIDRLLENRLNHANANGDKVDPSVWVAEVAENLADIIVFGAPENLRPQMLRYAIKCLKTFVEHNERILDDDQQKSPLQ